MSNSTWNATVTLGAKLNPSFQTSFAKSERTMEKFGKTVAKCGHTFLKLTGAMTAAHVAGELVTGAFERIGEGIRGATEAAWQYDKAMSRIKSSIMANPRIYYKGAPAPTWVRANEFSNLQTEMRQTGRATGTKAGVMAALVNSMTMQGMTKKDVSEMMPQLGNLLVAKDIQDEEGATELGNSLARTIMKDQPLHATRQGVGTVLGLAEKDFRGMFFKGKGEDEKAISVPERVAMLTKLMEMQYAGMAKNIMATEEGTRRMAGLWNDIYVRKVGEVTKRIGLTWDHMVDEIFPKFEPMIDGWITNLESFIDRFSKKWDSIWNRSQEWLDKSFIPGINKVAGDVAHLSVDIAKLMLRMVGGASNFYTPEHKDRTGGGWPLSKPYKIRGAKLTGLGQAEWETSQALSAFDIVATKLDTFAKDPGKWIKGAFDSAFSSNPWWQEQARKWEGIGSDIKRAAVALEKISSLWGILSPSGNDNSAGGGTGGVGSPKPTRGPSNLLNAPGANSSHFGTQTGQVWIKGTGIRDDQGYVPGSGWMSYGELGTEGHSSNWNGTHDLRAESAYGIGLGSEVEKAYDVTEGQWVYVDGLGWRKINENSSRPHGIEKWAPDAAHDKRPERYNISRVHRGIDKPSDDYKGDGVTQNVNVHFNGVNDRDKADYFASTVRQQLRKTFNA